MNIIKKLFNKVSLILFTALFCIVVCNSVSYAKPKLPANESKDKVSVYIRVEGYDHTIVPRTKITVGIFDLNYYKSKAKGSSATPSKGWPASRFKNPTVAHALVKVLEQKSIKYDMQDYGWSLYFAMIANEREFDILSTSGWMYRINGDMPPIGSQAYTLKGGEDIVWYFGAYGYNNMFTEIYSNKTKAKKGENIILTLYGRKDILETGKSTRAYATNAQIYVNGKPFKANGKQVVTNNKGQAVIKFDKPGTYKITAERLKKGKRDIVRPLPVIIKITK